MAEPPTTTNSTPCSAQSALHNEANLRLLSVPSFSAVMSASALVRIRRSIRADWAGKELQSSADSLLLQTNPSRLSQLTGVREQLGASDGIPCRILPGAVV